MKLDLKKIRNKTELIQNIIAAAVEKAPSYGQTVKVVLSYDR